MCLHIVLMFLPILLTVPLLFPTFLPSIFPLPTLALLAKSLHSMSPLLMPMLVFILNNIVPCTESCRPLKPTMTRTSFHFSLVRNRLVVTRFSKPNFLKMALLIVTKHVLFPRGVIILRGLIILIVSPLWLNQSLFAYF